MICIGVDPGKSGAIAWIDTLGMSYHSENPYGFFKLDATERDIYDQFDGLAKRGGGSNGVFGIIEQVNAMPGGGKRKMGATSAFNFGKSYGGLRMALIAARIPFNQVTPRKWQEEFGLTKKYDSLTKKKNAHKAVAQELFPLAKITHANADALLIAEYCRRQNAP